MFFNFFIFFYNVGRKTADIKQCPGSLVKQDTSKTHEAFEKVYQTQKTQRETAGLVGGAERGERESCPNAASQEQQQNAGQHADRPSQDQWRNPASITGELHYTFTTSEQGRLKHSNSLNVQT
jgi:hypothetical protein